MNRAPFFAIFQSGSLSGGGKPPMITQGNATQRNGTSQDRGTDRTPVGPLLDPERPRMRDVTRARLGLVQTAVLIWSMFDSDIL